jgi:hypothetical protein
MKYILSSCPIHSGCMIEVVFGEDEDERIPFPDFALKDIADRDFPGLVPIEVEHHRAQRMSSAISG